jgi:hypothetical protein
MSAPDGPDLRERPAGELLKDLSQQTSTLVRQELDLAKAELSQKGKQLGAGAGLLVGAAIVALLALGALTAGLIAVLATAVAMWLAAVIVAVVYAALAGALAIAGRGRIQKAAPPAPEQTIETVKEDVQWAKTRTRSGRT